MAPGRQTRETDRRGFAFPEATWFLFEHEVQHPEPFMSAAEDPRRRGVVAGCQSQQPFA